MPVNITQKDAILHEIIRWCEQEADKQADMYRSSYGEERVRADTAGDTFTRVATHCRNMLGYAGSSMPLEVPNQSVDAHPESPEP